MKNKNGINLTKSQKKLLSSMPKGWLSEEQALSSGLGISTLRALQSKGCIHHKVEDGKSCYIKTL